LLKGIKYLLYHDGYTIRGVQKVIKESGTRKILKKESNINFFTDNENNNNDHQEHFDHGSHSISETKRKKLMNVLNDLVNLKNKLNQE